MESLRESAKKIRTQLAGKTDMVQKTIITCLILILVAVICIFSNSLSNIQQEYTGARNELGQSIYTNLYELYTECGAAEQPGADMPNTILPGMREHYYAARTLDDAMARCYGSEYQVLTATVRSAINDVFSAYADAYRMGKSTATADEGLEACANSLESILLTRFDKNGIVQPMK